MSEREDSEHSSAQPAVTDVQVQIEPEVRLGGGNDGGGGGGGGGKDKKKTGSSLEERARRMLGTSDHTRPGSGASSSTTPPQQPTYPPPGVYPAGGGAPNDRRPSGRVAGYVPFEGSDPLHGPPTALALQAFQLSSVIRPPETTPPAQHPIDPWATGGSLKPMEGEEVSMRRAGILTDYFNVYVLMTYIMLTNRRVVIKQKSSLLGFNLYTVEASFLYENLRHVTLQRITNFRFLWGGLTAFPVAIVLFGLGAVFWIYAVVGIGVFFGGVFALYWFSIFYNANSLVLDFSKDEIVGSWGIPRAKGAFISKILVLHIDHCFDITYALYNHAGTIFAENKA